MQAVAGEGRTVLFVSHNLASVKALCNKAILLRQGRLVADGGVDEVVEQYISDNQPARGGEISADRQSTGTGEARFQRVRVTDRDGMPIPELYLGQPFSVSLDVEVKSAIPDAVFEVDISTLDGTYITTSFSVDNAQPPMALTPGRHRVVLDLDLTLIPGQYSLDLGLHHTGAPWTIDFLRRTLDFHALNVSQSGGDRYLYEARRGFVRPVGRWRLHRLPSEL